MSGLGRQETSGPMSFPKDWGLLRTECKPSPLLFSCFCFILIATLISFSQEIWSIFLYKMPCTVPPSRQLAQF